MYNDHIPTIYREQLINTRISERNIPSQELPPLLSFYPKSTKYHSIVDYKVITNTKLKDYEIFNTTQVFNPGTKSPWHGYVNAIDVESELKNQIFQLNRSSKNVYVPSSTSVLYKHPTMNSTQVVSYSFLNNPPLYTKDKKSTFHNHTRNQLKDVYNSY